MQVFSSSLLYVYSRLSCFDLDKSLTRTFTAQRPCLIKAGHIRSWSLQMSSRSKARQPFS